MLRFFIGLSLKDSALRFYYDLLLSGEIPDDFEGTDDEARYYANVEYHPVTNELIIGLGSEFIILDKESILNLRDMINLVIEKEKIE